MIPSHTVTLQQRPDPAFTVELEDGIPSPWPSCRRVAGGMGINLSCDGRVARLDAPAAGRSASILEGRLPQVLVIHRNPEGRPFDGGAAQNRLLHQKKCLHLSMDVTPSPPGP